MSRGEIGFEKVSFHYGRADGVIEEFSLAIRPGEKVGIVGRSGAGKSTLVNLLLRFYDLESGRILIDGQDIAGVTEESLRVAIGMVTQDTSLLHRSVRDNIAYGKPDARETEIVEAAVRAEADGFIRELRDPNGRTGYDAFVGERGVKLSGGQRQRIAIARLLLKDAPILILDEATSALDSEVEAAIQASLSRLMQGKTVIAIAHRLSTIAAMDRLVVLDRGPNHRDRQPRGAPPPGRPLRRALAAAVGRVPGAGGGGGGQAGRGGGVDACTAAVVGLSSRQVLLPRSVAVDPAEKLSITLPANLARARSPEGRERRLRLEQRVHSRGPARVAGARSRARTAPRCDPGEDIEEALNDPRPSHPGKAGIRVISGPVHRETLKRGLRARQTPCSCRLAYAWMLGKTSRSIYRSSLKTVPYEPARSSKSIEERVQFAGWTFPSKAEGRGTIFAPGLRILPYGRSVAVIAYRVYPGIRRRDCAGLLRLARTTRR